MAKVRVAKNRRLRLPPEVMRALFLEGKIEMDVEVDALSDAIILRPAPLPARYRDDAWAYDAHHLQLLERAHRDSREGRIRQLSWTRTRRRRTPDRVAYDFKSLDATETFVESYSSPTMSAPDRSLIMQALQGLDRKEHVPAMQVHQLVADPFDAWVASAGRALRITFERLDEGRDRLLTCVKIR